jgi:hypothetical protein
MCPLDRGNFTMMGEEDQLWVFETSGIGAHQRTGLAREQGGKVVDILMFP